jgi:hypothetical protein
MWHLKQTLREEWWFEMRSIKLSCLVIIAVLVLTGSLACVSFAQDDDTLDKAIQMSNLVDEVKGGKIDWANEWMYATGEGAVPPSSKVPNRAIALLKAKDYAKMAAIANLLMVVEGTTISYEGLGKDYMANVGLRQKIEGYVKNVEIISWSKFTSGADTIVRVTVGTRMYGTQTPGTAFLEKIRDDAEAAGGKKKAVPLIEIPEERSVKRPPDSVMKAEIRGRGHQIASSMAVDLSTLIEKPVQVGPFTSLIVDTRGYDVRRSMSPKIRRLDGTEVWGTLADIPEDIMENGLVAYVKTMDDALANDRAGRNPLTAIAVGRAGGKAMADTVVSDDDATFILNENKKTQFLDKFNIIFVTDPGNSKPK